MQMPVGAWRVLVEPEAQSQVFCRMGVFQAMFPAPCPLCSSSLARKPKLHLSQRDLNYQLELLRQAVFYSLNFFKICPPQCKKPPGHLSRIVAMLPCEEIKTHTCENILFAPWLVWLSGLSASL